MSEAGGVRYPLGQSGHVWRDDYDPAAEYYYLHAVKHGNAVWMWRSRTPGTGVEPGTDPVRWQLLLISATTLELQQAQTAQQGAETARDEAETARDQAQTARGEAETARTGAQDAQAAAEAARDEAAGSASAAATSETNAAASAGRAEVAAASVDGPGLLSAVRTHPHDGTTDGGVKIAYDDLVGAPPVCPYGIGDILTTENPTHPAVRWPGTIWAEYAQGRALVGLDVNDPDFDTIGKEGGSKTHQHGMGAAYGKMAPIYNLGGLNYKTKTTPSWQISHGFAVTSVTGADSMTSGLELGGTTDSASNVPPHKVVYHWIRTGTVA